MQHTIDHSFNCELVAQYVNKYFVSVIGLYLVTRPLRQNQTAGQPRWASDEVAAYFWSNWREMEAFATSIKELFELANRLGRLSGFAARVSQLMCGLENIVVGQCIITRKCTNGAHTAAP